MSGPGSAGGPRRVVDLADLSWRKNLAFHLAGSVGHRVTGRAEARPIIGPLADGVAQATTTPGPGRHHRKPFQEVSPGRSIDNAQFASTVSRVPSRGL